MKGFGICNRGIEPIAAEEIKEIIGVRTKISDTVVEFSAKSQDMAKLCVRTQSLQRVLSLIAKAKVQKNLEKTLVSLKKAINASDLELDMTFKVICKRIGDHNFKSNDIVAKVGEVIVKKTGAKVSMKPDIMVYVHIYKTTAYIGIDYAGRDLSKRHYKVFVHPNSLNASIAYSLSRGIKGTILDPMCGAGTIPIEAALYQTGQLPHGKQFAFQKFMDYKIVSGRKKKADVYASDHILKFIKSTNHNAKLAGVEFTILKMEIEWLDTKLDKASVNAIVTNPPSESKHHDAGYILKLYKELFYQADYVLKKNGKIVLCVLKDGILKKALERFKIIDEYSVWQGQQELKVLVLAKQ